MKMVLVGLVIVGVGMFLSVGSVSAATVFHSGDVVEHGGRTDSNGCHRDTKQGTRHCH
ncbi:YHYH domain-containing protein [Halomonas sp. TD01]|uniref:YHYH domain-containing protein n=1 Tax=Halomonas sp. TD01 TaxID=999141 RepID=UPI001C8F850B|nr:hypothetical protein HPTD01_3173 [Halomonas sp. TD01]